MGYTHCPVSMMSSPGDIAGITTQHILNDIIAIQLMSLQWCGEARQLGGVTDKEHMLSSNKIGINNRLSKLIGRDDFMFCRGKWDLKHRYLSNILSRVIIGIWANLSFIYQVQDVMEIISRIERFEFQLGTFRDGLLGTRRSSDVYLRAKARYCGRRGSTRWLMARMRDVVSKCGCCQQMRGDVNVIPPAWSHPVFFERCLAPSVRVPYQLKVFTSRRQ